MALRHVQRCTALRADPLDNASAAKRRDASDAATEGMGRH